MIILEGVSKSFATGGSPRVVARELDFVVQDRARLALLGRNGAGKSSLLQLIAGSLRPDRGRIIRRSRVSWPVGFQGSFHPDLTGAENSRFVARLYARPAPEFLDFVEGFAELGSYFREPLRHYSAGMRARLAFAISMAVPFDIYLIDEVTSVGDARFREKSEQLLRSRLAQCGAIVVSHSLELLARLCTSGVVLENGRLFYYARVARAIEHHQYLMRGQLPPWLR